MKKVYCKNCSKYQKAKVSEFTFKISHCRINITTSSHFSPDGIEEILQLPMELNKNNDCPYYSRKWWKLWIA